MSADSAVSSGLEFVFSRNFPITSPTTEADDLTQQSFPPSSKVNRKLAKKSKTSFLPLQYFLLLFLVPFPRTSTFFVLSLLLCMFVTHKPCLYCSLVIFGLLASSCNYYTPMMGSSGVDSDRRCWVDLDSRYMFIGRGWEGWANVDAGGSEVGALNAG
ncbi:hypothetical protein DFS34DRAFT_654638 [Phlyctochytrium arcticum]|nr:hypothetical protein DFS34DRAFT_654638 [Phlyctochytrium arcticum]